MLSVTHRPGVLTREAKVPDAEFDPILAVFYAFKVVNGVSIQSGVVVTQNSKIHRQRLRGIQTEVVANELDLINRAIDITVDLDPDIVVGWEVQRSSWGYLDARAQHYGQFSRPRYCQFSQDKPHRF